VNSGKAQGTPKYFKGPGEQTFSIKHKALLNNYGQASLKQQELQSADRQHSVLTFVTHARRQLST